MEGNGKYIEYIKKKTLLAHLYYSCVHIIDLNYILLYEVCQKGSRTDVTKEMRNVSNPNYKL